MFQFTFMYYDSTFLLVYFHIIVYLPVPDNLPCFEEIFLPSTQNGDVVSVSEDLITSFVKGRYEVVDEDGK